MGAASVPVASVQTVGEIEPSTWNVSRLRAVWSLETRLRAMYESNEGDPDTWGNAQDDES
jgi:hypothetical protein